MRIILSDGSNVDLALAGNPITDTLLRVYKHLQHIPIPFRAWDNPFFYKTISYDQFISVLVDLGQRVGVTVEPDRCVFPCQDYVNHLHRLYENGYDGNPDWLSFHEHIHLCESFFYDKLDILTIDYREKSGPLERPFQYEWTNHLVTKIQPGDVFVPWAELGKTPYNYWRDDEPDDLDRLCELAKPWLKLRPKLCVSLEQVDRLDKIDAQGFEPWWQARCQRWCEFWDLPNWTVENMYGVSVIGRVVQYQRLVDCLEQNINPTHVVLS